MRSGRDILVRALWLLDYTDLLADLDDIKPRAINTRGLAAVNQIYGDLWYTGREDPFLPLTSLDEPVLLNDRQTKDVMPYGVAMLLAMSEGDSDSQQMYAAMYNRKRAAAPITHRRKDVLFAKMREEAGI
ncbi:MAG: hypothetical protein J6L00_02330 [Clostridia bacterium]|nr:hypothetical protein [Clostridia bacterium]